MRRLRALAHRVSSLFGRARRDRELADEFESHIAFATEERTRRGLDPAEARRQAILAFGGVERAKEAYRDRRGVPFIESMLQDLRFALRSARRAPLFCLLAVVTIGLGIGVNTAVFGVFKSVLLDPLPYDDASRLVRVYSMHEDAALGRAPLSIGVAADIAARARSFARVASFRQSLLEHTLIGPDGPRVVTVATVSAEFFGTLGVRAALGRTMGDGDVAPAATQVAMLSHEAWQRLFAGDRAILDRPLRLEGAPVAVVGVLPPGFVGPSGPADVWVPLDLRPFLGNPIGERRLRMLGLVGRLAPGTTPIGAARELAVLGRELAREHPDSDGSFSLESLPLRNDMVGDTRTPLIVVMASAALVLLIVCVNLAAAFLSRTITRRREFAVRAAIGAGRGRLVRQLLTESSLLALAGGALGVALAVLGQKALRAFALNALPSYASPSLDGGGLVFGFGLTLLAGLAFGLVPSLAVTRSGAWEALLHASSAVTESLASRRFRGLLVAGQIALSVSLLAGAGLLGRSFRALVSTPLGFDPAGVVTVPIRLPVGSYPPAMRASFYDRLERRLRAVPGVSRVASTTVIPTPTMGRSDFRIEGVDWPADVQPFAIVASVSDDYFRTMRIDLRMGRTFGPSDRTDSTPTVVISETMARRFWPNGGALGARLRVGPNANAAWSEIVGIVADVRNDPARGEPEPVVYGSIRRTITGTRSLVVRASGDPLALFPVIRHEVASIDSTLPTDRMQELSGLVTAGLSERRLPVLLIGAFAALALLLASVGIHAMFATMAAAREREFSIRMALGSDRAAIRSLIVRQAALWTAIGLVMGAVGVVALSRALRGMLYGVSPFDAVALSGAVTMLLTCGAVALILPIRRATRVDPISILR